MITSKTALFLFFFFISLSGYSNFRSFPGYYINNSGDSVKCNFKFNNWRSNPKTIQVDVNGKTLTLGPSDVQRFGIFDYGEYRSARITFHPCKISGLNLPENYSDKTETGEYFLKILSKGKYSLYAFILPERPYYFVEQSDTISELIYRVRQSNMKVDYDETYKKVVYALFLQEGLVNKYVSTINAAGYNQSDLQSLFGILNEKSNGITYRKKREKSIEADLFVCRITNSFPSTFDGHYSEGNKFDNSTAFSGGINLIYHIPNHFRSFAMGVSIGLNKYSSTTSKTDSIVSYSSLNSHSTTQYNERLTLSNSLIMTNLYAMHYFNKFSQVKFYVKGGLNCNISTSSNNHINSDYSSTTITVRNGNADLPKSEEGITKVKNHKRMYFNFRADAGVKFDRHKLEFAYYSPVSLNANYKINMYGIYYYFTVIR